MQLSLFQKRINELHTPRGDRLLSSHMAVWHEIKDLKFADQMWVIRELVDSIKKRQELQYCRKCRGTNCQCKEQNNEVS